MTSKTSQSELLSQTECSRRQKCSFVKWLKFLNILNDVRSYFIYLLIMKEFNDSNWLLIVWSELAGQTNTDTSARDLWSRTHLTETRVCNRGHIVKRRIEHCHKGITRGQRKIILTFSYGIEDVITLIFEVFLSRKSLQ